MKLGYYIGVCYMNKGGVKVGDWQVSFEKAYWQACKFGIGFHDVHYAKNKAEKEAVEELIDKICNENGGRMNK